MELFNQFTGIGIVEHFRRRSGFQVYGKIEKKTELHTFKKLQKKEAKLELIDKALRNMFGDVGGI